MLSASNCGECFWQAFKLHFGHHPAQIFTWEWTGAVYVLVLNIPTKFEYANIEMIWFVRKGRPDCLSLLSYLILLLVCMFFRVCFLLLLCFLVFDFGKFVHVFFAVSSYIPVSVPSPGSFLWFNFCLPLSSRFLSYRVLLPSDMYSLGFFILLLAWFGFCFLFLIKVVFVFVVFVSLFYSLSFSLCQFLFVVILAAIFLSMSRRDNYDLRGWLGVKSQSPIYLSSFPLLSLRLS